jgi:hypothetical protein
MFLETLKLKEIKTSSYKKIVVDFKPYIIHTAKTDIDQTQGNKPGNPETLKK